MAEKILIVDDDLDTLRLVGLLLERQGYEIVVADNGSHALDKAISENPDIILLDVMMPDLDGFEVASRLRGDAMTSKIPIIFFTAKTQVEDKVAGFEAGGDDYLTKPVHPAELTARVRAILSRSGIPEGAEAEPSPPLGKGIGILSARGGVGVTSLALSLGIVLQHESNEKVVVAEIRPGQGSIGLDLGLPAPIGLPALLESNPREIQAEAVNTELIEHSSGVHLLLASSQPSDAQYIQCIDQFDHIITHLRSLASYTVLDLGPALPPLSEMVLGHCEQLIVAVEPEPNVVVHTKALLDDLSLKVLGLDRISVAVINRTRSDLKLSRTQIQEQLGINVPFVFTPVPEIAYQAARAKVPMILSQGGQADPQLHNNIQQLSGMAEAVIKFGQKVVSER